MMASLVSAHHEPIVDGRWATLFEPDIVKVGIESTSKHWVRSSQLPDKHSTKYNFDIPNFGDAFLDLKSVQLYVMGHMERRDGTKLTATKEQVGNAKLKRHEKIYPANNFLHSLFETAKCYVGNNQVEVEEPMYAYKAYIKRSNMQGQEYDYQEMYHQPSLSRGDDPLDIDNWYKRGFTGIWIGESKKCDMLGYLNMGFFSTQGYLLPNTPLKVQLSRTAPEFYCLTKLNKQYIFWIEDIALGFNTLKVNPGLVYEIDRRVESSPCRYSWDQTVIRQHTIPQGVLTTTIPKLFEGILPRKLMLCFASQQAITGAYSADPYLFRNMGVKKIAVKVNNEEEKVLHPNFTDGLFAETYDAYLKWFAIKYNLDKGINRYNFQTASSFFCFDMLEGCPEGEKCSDEMLQGGVLSASMTFDVAPTEPMVLLVVAVMPMELTLSETRMATIEKHA